MTSMTGDKADYTEVTYFANFVLSDTDRIWLNLIESWNINKRYMEKKKQQQLLYKVVSDRMILLRVFHKMFMIFVWRTC